jgi:hypothetical protein
LKGLSWRQCYGTSALLDASEDQPRVTEFLAVDDDLGLRDLWVDHIIAIVDQSQLESQVFRLTRCEDGMADVKSRPKTSRLLLLGGTKLGGGKRSLSGAHLREICHPLSLIPGLFSQQSLQPQCLCLTERPDVGDEQEGAQRHSDHERPDRESESALTVSFNHEFLVAVGNEIAVD